MTYQNRGGSYPGAHARANDPGQGRWGERQQESQLHESRGYALDPIRGKRLPYEPDFDRVFKVANVTSIGPNSESGPYTVYWPHGGLVVSMAGTGLGDGTVASQSSLACKIQIGDGRESILVQGGTLGSTTEAYVSFSTLFGAFNERRFLLKRPVYPTLSWTIQFFNFHASNTYTPELAFFMDSDPGDVRRHYGKSIAVPEGTEVEVYGQRGSYSIDTHHGARR